MLAGASGAEQWRRLIDGPRSGNDIGLDVAFDGAGNVVVGGRLRNDDTGDEMAVAKLSGVMTDASARVNSLQAAHDALLHAALWERPFVFLRHLDPGIARATGAVYQPAVPTTAEGLIYAFAGMVFILALYHLGVKRLLGLFTRPSAPAKSPA